MLDALRTNPQIRSALRRAGLVPVLSRAWSILVPRDHEEAFSTAMLSAIRTGDVVWDIGANVGAYTRLFAERTGARGLVVAAEPIASTFEALKANVGSLRGVEVRNVALGSRPGELDVPLDSDPTSPVVTLTRTPSAGDVVQRVQVTTGDDWVSDGVAQPNVVKIDVEGYEEEVLRGMEGVLRNPACRDVFVEVHFATLERRGLRRAPQRVASLLADFGLRTHWVDPSHLHGHRNR